MSASPAVPGAGSAGGPVMGVAVAAGTVLLISGAYGVIQGLVGLVDPGFYRINSDPAVQVELTAWGWIHVLVGALAFAAGVGVILGLGWSRPVALIVAGVSAIANFVWLPVYPAWSITVIVLDIFVIWMVTVRWPRASGQPGAPPAGREPAPGAPGPHHPQPVQP